MSGPENFASFLTLSDAGAAAVVAAAPLPPPQPPPQPQPQPPPPLLPATAVKKKGRVVDEESGRVIIPHSIFWNAYHQLFDAPAKPKTQAEAPKPPKETIQGKGAKDSTENKAAAQCARWCARWLRHALTLQLLGVCAIAISVAWSQPATLAMHTTMAAWSAPLIVLAGSAVGLVTLLVLQIPSSEAARSLLAVALLLALCAVLGSAFALATWAASQTVCDPLVNTIWLTTKAVLRDNSNAGALSLRLLPRDPDSPLSFAYARDEAPWSLVRDGTWTLFPAPPHGQSGTHNLSSFQLRIPLLMRSPEEEDADEEDGSTASAPETEKGAQLTYYYAYSYRNRGRPPPPPRCASENTESVALGRRSVLAAALVAFGSWFIVAYACAPLLLGDDEPPAKADDTSKTPQAKPAAAAPLPLRQNFVAFLIKSSSSSPPSSQAGAYARLLGDRDAQNNTAVDVGGGDDAAVRASAMVTATVFICVVLSDTALVTLLHSDYDQAW